MKSLAFNAATPFRSKVSVAPQFGAAGLWNGMASHNMEVVLMRLNLRKRNTRQRDRVRAMGYDGV